MLVAQLWNKGDRLLMGVNMEVSGDGVDNGGGLVDRLSYKEPTPEADPLFVWRVPCSNGTMDGTQATAEASAKNAFLNCRRC